MNLSGAIKATFEAKRDEVKTQVENDLNPLLDALKQEASTGVTLGVLEKTMKQLADVSEFRATLQSKLNVVLTDLPHFDKLENWCQKIKAAVMKVVGGKVSASKCSIKPKLEHLKKESLATLIAQGEQNCKAMFSSCAVANLVFQDVKSIKGSKDISSALD